MAKRTIAFAPARASRLRSVRRGPDARLRLGVVGVLGPLLAALLILGVLVATTGVTGCAPARSGSLPLFGPLTLDARQKAGAAVYAEHCYMCHPGGEAGIGPALSNKPLPAVLIKLQVRKGAGAMPTFDERLIADGALDDLAAYVIALRR